MEKSLLSSNILSIETDDLKEIKTGILKVRGKTLVFGNSIYQIPNLSGIEVIKLSTTRSLPSYFWVMPTIGLGLLLLGYFDYFWFVAIGILLLALSGYWLYLYLKNRLTEAYGLRIILNAGTSRIIVAKDKEFLKKIALVLYNIMNSKDYGDVTFNIDQRKIDMKGVAGSMLVMGNVSGDVVNNV